MESIDLNNIDISFPIDTMLVLHQSISYTFDLLIFFIKELVINNFY